MFPSMVYMSSDAASKQIVSAKTEGARRRRPSEVHGSAKAMDSRQKHQQGYNSQSTAMAQQHTIHQKHVDAHGTKAASHWPEDATEPLDSHKPRAAQVVHVSAGDKDLFGTLSDINSISVSSTDPHSSSGTRSNRSVFLRLKHYLQKLEKKCDKFHYWDRRWQCAV